MARYAVLEESLTDQVKCQKVSNEKVCNMETTGSYTVVAKITGDAFTQRGINLAQIDETTPLGITIGEFSFSSTFGAAVTHKLTGRKLRAKWIESDIKCRNAECTKTRRVRHTKVTMNGGLQGLTVKIEGSSLVNQNNDYGQRALADMCNDAGNHEVLQVPATLTINGIPVGATLRGICKVRVRSVNRNGEIFQVRRINIKAKEKDDVTLD